MQKEQGIIGQEIRMYQDEPNWQVMFNCLRALYKVHPVRIDIAGTNRFYFAYYGGSSLPLLPHIL